MIDYPHDVLPCFQRRSLAIPFQDGRERVRPEYGPDLLGLMTTASPFIVPVEFIATLPRVMALHRFYFQTTARGTLPFRVQDPLLHNTYLTDENFEILGDEFGVPILVASYWIARFQDAGQIDRLEAQPRKRVAFSLEVLHV